VRKVRYAFAAALVVVAVAVALAMTRLPELGAGGLLHPARRQVVAPAPAGCEDASFAGDDVSLKGWQCRATGGRRATIVYLHGTADNRTSAAGLVKRFGPRGFAVVAYDSRAHGESGGEACTYGFYEKRDLQRVMDTIDGAPVVLFGTSLGAAVALQEAAGDSRAAAIVAVETFSDLRTIASERAPFFFTAATIRGAFQLAETQGRFQVDAVSPKEAAAHITAPVLLVHGDADVETPPAHSQRVFAALKGPKRLILVPGAGHNGSLRAEVWDAIERWLDEVLLPSGMK
jgi:pimeloyl-ACP methyl ester carboxylesterase